MGQPQRVQDTWGFIHGHKGNEVGADGWAAVPVPELLGG